MKIKLLMLLILGMMLTQCRNYVIKSTVTADNHIIRSVETVGDSTSVEPDGYPFPQDEKWTQTKKQNEDGEYVYTTTRMFENINQLNEYCRDDSIVAYSKVDSKKLFRWFFTYFRYTETFPTFNTLQMEPMENYLSEDQYKQYLVMGDSSGFEDKVEEWLLASIFNEFWLDFEKAAPQADAKFSANYLQEIKPQMFQQIMKADSNGVDVFKDDMVASILTILDSLLAPQQSFLNFAQDFERSSNVLIGFFTNLSETSGDEFELHVSMPGRIIDTNAQQMDSTQTMVSWNFDNDNFSMRDYSMWVEARKFNPIPTGATGVIFLLALIVLFKPKKAESGV